MLDRILCTKVLLVPFQTPQAPSCVQSVESAPPIDEAEARLCTCVTAGPSLRRGEGEAGGDRDEVCRRRRVGFCAEDGPMGAAEVKYDCESLSESSDESCCVRQ